MANFPRGQLRNHKSLHAISKDHWSGNNWRFHLYIGWPQFQSNLETCSAKACWSTCKYFLLFVPSCVWAILPILTNVLDIRKSNSIKWYCSWFKLWEFNRNECHWNQATNQSLVWCQPKTDQSEIIWVGNWNACLFLRFKDKSMAKIYKHSNNTQFCKFWVPNFVLQSAGWIQLQ